MSKWVGGVGKGDFKQVMSVLSRGSVLPQLDLTMLFRDAKNEERKAKRVAVMKAKLEAEFRAHQDMEDAREVADFGGTELAAAASARGTNFLGADEKEGASVERARANLAKGHEAADFGGNDGVDGGVGGQGDGGGWGGSGGNVVGGLETSEASADDDAAHLDGEYRDESVALK